MKASIDDQTQRSFNEFSWEQLAAIVTCQRLKDVFFLFTYYLTCFGRFASFGGFVSLVSFWVLVHALILNRKGK